MIKALGDLHLASKSVERRDVAEDGLVGTFEHDLPTVRTGGQEDVTERAVADGLAQGEAVQDLPDDEVARCHDRKNRRQRRVAWWPQAGPVDGDRQGACVVLAAALDGQLHEDPAG